VDYKVSYLPLALEDLEGIVRYIVYKLEAPLAAQKLRDALHAAVQNLVRAPFGHPLYRTKRQLKMEYRRIAVKNYSVFYVVKDNHIEIHRVIYTKRNLEALLD
jgi:plasmid stabilization system protein ParE